jgi:methylase of polypeptide subunit release factors
MSQRDSGYERKERDLYETPEWVTHALLDGHLRPPKVVWEPACGSGKMVRALGLLDAEIIGSDIETGSDFLSVPLVDADAIITNPPYAQAEAFIRVALNHVKPFDGMVAMLLRTDFDHAKTRQYLFGGCPQFARKVVLTKRIQWFEDSKGSPSFNHAWFIWDWKHEGAPTLAYGP